MHQVVFDRWRNQSLPWTCSNSSKTFFCVYMQRFKGGFVPAIHAAASMMEAGQGGDKEGAKAVQ